MFIKMVKNSETNIEEEALSKSENTRKYLIGKHEPSGKLIKLDDFVLSSW